MNIYTTIFAEFLFFSSTILLLFKLRSKLGLAPLYILLGTLQYLLVFSDAYISLEILDKYTIYPGSIIIFSAVLFAVLLIYIKEGVTSARALIIGIVISNFLISALFGITYLQESVIGLIENNQAKSIFILDYKYFITGTIILFFDFILLAIIYQYLISRNSKLPFFYILFISLLSVLIIDAFAFNVILKFGAPDFNSSLVGHIIGKSFSALIFSIILYVYLKYLDNNETNATFIANQNRDVFSIINYRTKYINLKAEKNQVEKKLTSQIETTLNLISDGFVALDTNWHYTYINIKAAEFLGKSPESLIGKHVWTEFPEGIGLPFYKAYYKAVETQEKQYFETYYEPIDRWFENRVYPSKEGLTIFFTDITERKKAEDQLIKNKSYLENIINNIGDPVFVKDDKSHFLIANDAFYKLFNRTKEEILGKTFAEDTPVEERERYLKIDSQVISKGIENVSEVSFIGKGGETRIISIKKNRYIDESGKNFLIGTIRDITESKNAEEQIIKSKKYLDNILNNIGDLVFVKDEQSRILLVNDSFCNFFNLSRSEIIGKTLAENVSFDEREMFFSIDKQVLLTGVENINEESITLEGMETRIVSTKKTRFIDDSGNKFLIGVVRDITARKKAEITIKESEEKFSKAFKSNVIGKAILNKEKKIIEVNEALANIVGIKRENMLEKTAEEMGLFTLDDQKNLDNETLLWSEFSEKGYVSNVELNYKMPDEKELFILISLQALDLNNEEHIMITVIDITEKKHAEAELEKYRNNLEELVEFRTSELEKEKIKAQSADLMKSAFLATMSHELRTPMNSIIGFTGILLKEYAGPLNEEQKKQLSMVKNSSQHLLGLINDVLDISKIEAGKLKVSFYPFNYLSTLEKTIDFLKPQALKKGLVINSEISEMEIILNSDERRVEQVLLNLLSNAIKFSNKGGITVKVDVLDSLLITQVIDQGIGISKKDLNKLFMPFIQIDAGLSRNHEGTGLGLAICKNIIEKLGGSIHVKSKKGEGSNFTFKIPIKASKNT
ncbi:PAS domain-containing hybrid sensor histidine kinase/response regulator [Xanthomarina sp. F2636L]|uniref:PAS domain-containing protein n=1 Tax=Xanthomarina sp. F2636L TaxID=2996018 RepID=UPI00225DE7FE|nr:PAS domain-containing hybrid sensor histidine kinase/response regulator [Xanthomarina sp. F2636L]MCX7550897.1 PAS domain S-box protein [Xanthomarina sp. F2636L]